MNRIILVTFLLLLGSKAFSYPIFFSCDANKSLSTVLTPAELANRLNQMAAAETGKSGFNQKDALDKVCRDFKECILSYSHLMELAQPLAGAARDQILEKVKAEANKSMQTMKEKGFLKVSSDDMSFLSQFHKMQTMTYTCKAQESMESPEKMVNSNGDCAVGNFHDTPYMYVTGERFSREPDGESKSTGKVACKAIDDMVNAAVAMGQDPLATIAIGMMEKGTEIQGLYLDPVGIITALGCPAKPVSASVANAWTEKNWETSEKCQNKCITEYLNDQAKMSKCASKCENSASRPYNLNSFATFYNVQYKSITNPNLEIKIRDYLKLKDAPLSEGKSYFCSNGDEHDVVDKPASNSCCLSLGFKSDSMQIKNALTYSSLQHYLRSPLASNHQSSGAGESPARRLQRFNGFSPLMGGAEPVSAWRSGVNYNKTPAYGYQAMDFILNSLATNPYIMDRIRKAQEKIGKKTPSVLCEDLTQGSYAIEHDFYTKAHGNAPRMGTIQDKWDSGTKSWSQLTRAQQSVLSNEFASVCQPRTSKILAQSFETSPQTKSGFDEFCKSSSFFYPTKMDSKAQAQIDAKYRFYMTQILPLRRTVAQAAKMDLGYSWKEMTDDHFKALIEKVKVRAKLDSL